MAYVPKYISKTIGKGGKPVYKYSSKFIARSGRRYHAEREGHIHQARFDAAVVRRGGISTKISTLSKWPGEKRATVVSDRYARYGDTTERSQRVFRNVTPSSARRFRSLTTRIGRG